MHDGNAEQKLLANLATRKADLAKLFEKASGHWGYEDPVYRFYHVSYKVFYVQDDTLAIVKALSDLVRQQLTAGASPVACTRDLAPRLQTG